jgi:hypothetical protein
MLPRPISPPRSTRKRAHGGIGTKQFVRPVRTANVSSVLKLEAGAASAGHEKAYVGGSLADNDGIAVGEGTPVDIDGEIACRKTRKRAAYAACKFVVRRSHADRFAYGEDEHIPNAHGCCEGESDGTPRSHGMKIERHAHANHTSLIWRIFEEPPAMGEYR